MIILKLSEIYLIPFLEKGTKPARRQAGKRGRINV